MGHKSNEITHYILIGEYVSEIGYCSANDENVQRFVFNHSFQTVDFSNAHTHTHTSPISVSLHNQAND